MYSCAGSDPSATHAYSNSNPNCDSNGYSYCFSDSHRYSCGNADRDANVSADAHAAGYSNAEAASDGGAAPIACFLIKTQIDSPNLQRSLLFVLGALSRPTAQSLKGQRGLPMSSLQRDKSANSDE